jgi:hypothetical protein
VRLRHLQIVPNTLDSCAADGKQNAPNILTQSTGRLGCQGCSAGLLIDPGIDHASYDFARFRELRWIDPLESTP